MMSSRPQRRCKATQVSQQVTDNDGGSDELLDDATAITSSESEQEDSEEEYQPGQL
ncbi:hypothetical protein JCM5350_006646, partial [Sporobolomyces pararoseus]